MILICLALGAAKLGAQAELFANAAALLEKADRSLAPEDSRFSLRLENFGDGKNVVSEYDCYNRGSDRFLMIFKAPPALLGQAQLKVDDSIYHYVRKVDKTLQTSAKAQFAASLFTQEDVMSRQLAALYNVQSLEEARLDGSSVYLLSLVGKTKDVAYKEIKLYLNKESGHPLLRDYYSHSGQLIKQLKIDKLELDDVGRPRRLELTMHDALRKGRGTRAFLSFTEYKKVNDLYFSRSYLKVLTE